MMQRNFFIWKKPQLKRGDGVDSIWLEIFYDLVFVIIIAELGDTFSRDISGRGFLQFCVLFVAVLWCWMGSTFYNVRFETNDTSHLLFNILIFFGLASLALHVQDGLGKRSVGFALSYAAVRTLIILMWLRAARYNPSARPMIKHFTIGFSLSVMLWTLSVFITPPIRFILWGIGLGSDLITPLTTVKIQSRMPRVNTSHVSERLGLLTLIMLGESLDTLIRGGAEKSPFTLSAGVTCTMGLLLYFSLWCVYFLNIMGRHAKKNLQWNFLWWYTHLPLGASLTGIGSGLINIVRFPQSFTASTLYLICGASCVFFLSIGVIEYALEKRGQQKEYLLLGIRMMAAIFAGSLIFLGNLSIWAILAFLLLLGISQALVSLLWGALIFKKDVDDDEYEYFISSSPKRPTNGGTI